MKYPELEHRKGVALPRYGDYNCVFKYILEQGAGVRCVLPPPITRRTLELGAANSPDTVCVPFKTLLGSMIESLEAGAETLVMSFGDCRLGYFGELQEQTLRDMGYQFDFVNLQQYNTGKPQDLLKGVRKVNPRMKYTALVRAALDAMKMLDYVDRFNDRFYQISGFARDRKAACDIQAEFLKAMYAATTREEIEAGWEKAAAAMEALPLDKPQEPLRVGIIGEYFTVMDPPSNLFLEKKLADMGVEVHRWMNLSSSQLKQYGGKNLRVRVQDLCRYAMGPVTTENVWCARNWAEAGYDGIIHVKSAACTPEIDAMPLLQQISSETRVPFLFLNYDTQTSDVGLMTRLEAFYDMIAMRKKVV